MKLYRIISNTRLFEFGDAILEVPILGRPLGQLQEEFAQALGLTIHDVPNEQEITASTYMVFREDLFFTQAFLQEALNISRRSNQSLQFALKENDFNRRFILPFSKNDSNDYVFDFKYVKKGSEIKHHWMSQTIYDYDVQLPNQIVKGGHFPMPQCNRFAAHIISPFHLLQVNMAVNLNRTISIQKGRLKSYFKGMRGKIGSFFFYHALRKLNKIGRRSFIHPTAVIEGSVIGDDVKIGAHAIVRLSHVGDGSTISDNVVVANSVLGKQTYISNSNYIELCMTYQEAFMIHGPYQFSIFGKNSACFAVINCDYRLDQNNIKIPTSIGIVDSKQPLLGIAYGHRSKTGGGSIIAAGRIVPNDLHINPPDNIHLKFDR